MEKYKRKPYSVQTDSAMVREKTLQTQRKLELIFPINLTIASHCCIKQRNSALKLQLNLKHILNLK